ncbi:MULTISPECIES: CPBP family glutamic-type intramembrane protease [Cyanophyceae]|uniref:CPBP family intramembrane metalloprotease n=1 Tax=Leptolyngbya subtilissima DQ-A4 TaxID=2933933 RepID=A0ABV0K0S8_9CYAN|nr:CPBP family intramembrane glutamic endopeptidase [Nodosilinea sp. FACHB-141]MBD2112207.1 CPBP family intramembrane metalloprotease [Nodosilinea sp. FACHB-141]
MPLTYPVAPQHKLPLLLPLYLLAPVAVEVHRHLANSTWSAYGIAWDWPFARATAAGFGVAAGGVALLVALQVGLGWRRWQSISQPVASEGAELSPTGHTNAQTISSPSPGVVLLAVLPLALFVGWIEELVFRGVLVNGLGQVLPVGLMAIAVCLIFAFSHLLWDGPAGMLQVPGLAVMGAVLLLARWAVGGSLGLAWGLHAGWVFAIAAIDALALLKPGKDGPVWLVGLPDQPLTGLLPLGLLVLTGVGVWALG